MDKRYYSQKHKMYTKSKDRKAKGSSFLLRLNISLGIAISVIGIYKLNNDLSQNMVATFNKLTENNISFSQLKEGASSIKSIGNGFNALGNDGEISLDEETLKYIENSEDKYVINNTPALTP